jgi:hypothetical protein
VRAIAPAEPEFGKQWSRENLAISVTRFGRRRDEAVAWTAYWPPPL